MQHLKKILRIFRHPKKRTEEIRFQLDKKEYNSESIKKQKSNKSNTIKKGTRETPLIAEFLFVGVKFQCLLRNHSRTTINQFLGFLGTIKKEKSSDSFERVLFNQTIGNDKMKQK